MNQIVARPWPGLILRSANKPRRCKLLRCGGGGGGGGGGIVPLNVSLSDVAFPAFFGTASLRNLPFENRMTLNDWSVNKTT